MRLWTKYTLKKGLSKKFQQKKHATFEDFEKAMGGYESNEYYSNIRVFFDRYFDERKKIWDNFLNKNLNKNQTILSLATGRGINELKLINEKFNITCSDLKVPECFNASKNIFGDFKYIEKNILQSSSEVKYDCIMAFSLIHIFSSEELKVFFNNVSDSLNEKGSFLLDFGGAEDNLYSFFYHDFYLKIEAVLIQFFGKLFKNPYDIITRHHGYRHKNNEIFEIAKLNGFKLVTFEQNDHKTEFERSKIISLLIKKIPFTRYFFYFLGKKLPFLRMAKFEKIANV